MIDILACIETESISHHNDSVHPWFIDEETALRKHVNLLSNKTKAGR